MNQLSYNVRGDKFANAGFACTGNLEEGIAQTIRMLDGIRHR